MISIRAIPIASILLLVYVCSVAGVRKLRYPRHYAALIDDYQLLPGGWGRMLVWAIGGAEITSAIAMMVPVTQRQGAAVVFALQLFYGLGIAINLMRGRVDIDCGCGSPRRHHPLGLWVLARNAVMLGLTTLPLFGGVTLIMDMDNLPLAMVLAPGGVLLYQLSEFLLSRDALLEDL